MKEIEVQNVLCAIFKPRIREQFLIKYSSLNRLEMQTRWNSKVVCFILDLNSIKIRRILGNPRKISRARRSQSSDKIGTTRTSHRFYRSDLIVSTRLTSAGFPRTVPKLSNVEKFRFLNRIE